MTVFLVFSGSYLKISRSILRMWKQEEVTVFTWAVMLSLSSSMIPRFLALVVGVGEGPRSAGHQVESHREVSF